MHAQTNYIKDILVKYFNEKLTPYILAQVNKISKKKIS